jgi:hypothetical protein
MWPKKPRKGKVEWAKACLATITKVKHISENKVRFQNGNVLASL